MASIKTLAELYAYFETGDKPTQAQFEDLIYTMMDGLSAKPKVYIALLTQSVTNDPTVTVVLNTLGVTPSVTRDDVGNYWVTATGKFTADKTVCEIDYNSVDTFGKLNIQRADVNICTIQSYDNTDTLADSLLLNNWIKITVYP